MNDCQNKKFFRLLHAYELGLLDNDQREQLELHIMKCEFCQRELKNLSKTILTISSSPEIQDTVEKLAKINGELTNGKQQSEYKTETNRKISRRPTVVYAIVAVAAVFLFLILKPWDIEFQTTKEATAQENLLAVMPFENLADKSDIDNLGWVLSNLVITDLSESYYLHVVSEQRLYDIFKLLDLDKGEAISMDIATKISKMSNAKWMLLGSIIQTKPKLVLTVRLFEVSSGDVIMSRRMAARLDEDMFSLVDKLTVEVKKCLSLPAEAWTEPDPAVADVTTHSPEAYQAFLKGAECIDKLFFREAYQYYRKAIEYDSTFAKAYWALAYSGDREMLNKAVKYSFKATRKEKLYIKSLQASMSGDIDLAIVYLKELIEFYPDEKIALFELAIFAISQKDYDEAFRLLNETLKIDPLYKMAYNEMLYLYYRIGEFDLAVEWANKYIAMVPSEPNPYDSRGDIFAGHGKLDEAIESYEKAHSIKPDFGNYESLFKLGRLHIYKGNYDRANELFREVVLNGEINNRIMARTYLALVPLYQGHFAEALNILNDGIVADRMDQMQAESASLIKYMIKADIFSELGDFQAAESELNKAIEIQESISDSNGIDFRPLQCFLYGIDGNFEMAEKIAVDLRSKDNDTERNSYWKVMARIEYLRGHFKESIGWLVKLGSEKTIDFEDNYLLGRAYLESGRHGEAAEVFEKMLKDYFVQQRLIGAISAVNTHYYLGLTYDNMGEFEKARQQYKLFTEIWQNSEPIPASVKHALERLAYLRQHL